MKVSVVVVTHNRLNLLKECLTNILKQNYEINNIFVINNNSTDGTIHYLNNVNNNRIIPINSKSNLGGAGGFSLGTKIAYEQSDFDYLWLMDDDTMPTYNALYNLIIKARELNYKFGFLCSNIKWWKNYNSSILNVPVVKQVWNEKLEHGVIGLESASFVSILISREAISEVGLPISEMFIWADDVEYTTRISKTFPSYFVPQSIAIHKCKTNSNNENIANTNENRLIYYKCMFRNRLYIYKHHYGFKRFIRKLLTYLIISLSIPFKAKNHKIKRLMYALSGIWNGIFFNPKIKFPNKSN